MKTRKRIQWHRLVLALLSALFVLELARTPQMDVSVTETNAEPVALTPNVEWR